MILTSEWPDVYGNLMVDWGEEYDALTKVGRQLLRVVPTDRKTGKASSATFFDLAKDKGEGQAFTEQDPQQGYAIIWTQGAIGTGITLTHEDFLFRDTLGMGDKVRGLAQSAHLRMEHDIAMRFRYGNQDNYTNPSGSSINIDAADGSALIYTAHPIPNSGVTMSNDLGAIPFNRENLITALNRFRQFRNEKGIKINSLRPTHIVCSDDEEMNDLVDLTIGSPDKSDTANRAINPLQRLGLQKIKLPGLQQDGTGAVDTTGRGYWFVVCLAQTDFFMQIAEEPMPVFPKFDMSDPNLPITGDHKVTTRATYALYTRRFHWVVGSFATKIG